MLGPLSTHVATVTWGMACLPAAYKSHGKVTVPTAVWGAIINAAVI